jgi:hypothetical protein
MRERIAGLEETIASLPSSPFDNEIATIKNDLAKLKALPAVPDAQLAQQLEGKLRNLATKILTSDPARLPTTKAIDHFWEKFGGSLMAAAEAIRRLA